MTDDRVSFKVHKAKLEIGRVSLSLAEIGLDGIRTRLRDIANELGDIESTLDLQFTEMTVKEEEC